MYAVSLIEVHVWNTLMEGKVCCTYDRRECMLYLCTCIEYPDGKEGMLKYPDGRECMLFL
jgi:hypothetical protein